MRLVTFQGTVLCEVLLLKGLDQFPFPTKRTAFEMLGGYEVVAVEATTR